MPDQPNHQPEDHPSADITVEQAKLLGNALRVKIVGAIVEVPKTSKQVADELGGTPGSIHYHIQKLYEGGLIDLVETRQVGGIVEKYYKSKAKWFNTQGTKLVDPVLADDFESSTSTQVSLRLELSSQQRDQMTEEFKALLEKWVGVSAASKAKDTKEYAIGIKLKATDEKTT
ncbi:winged helix-turn-helix domain-containing protein [Paenibacillus lemnae]|uniref:Helix-turn-helix transcriptional regulator n=1 Tax=Paenibacillus lemnae TaxID=1330551 RepID=A0A848M7E6_PAELE|nr:helix-turn-helix domain-containing protein [Paenibacillus lemnae]NMO95773.1 helix-turn-helix transcriptional regulator [Paenibacillus lemnae]